MPTDSSSVSPLSLVSDPSVNATDNDSSRRAIKRALISVSDKTGVVELANQLVQAGVDVVSTGGTAALLRKSGLPVQDVAEVTGFPEMLDGRVKTLHPRVHAGLLADMTQESHAQALTEQGIAAFDLLVVNLYPFAATVAAGAPFAECVEQIDIGGPAMIRAAAKNAASIAVVVDPSHYDQVRQALAVGGFTLAQRRRLAAQAFAHTASYDVAVASWMLPQVNSAAENDEQFPAWLGAAWTRAEVLRYGENPHQQAALYLNSGDQSGIAAAEQLHGKAMSYNNYVDADAALRAAHDFTEPAVAIIKHNNPCGIAMAPDGADSVTSEVTPDGIGVATGGADPIAQAHRNAHACDPLSAFGGVIAANRPVSAAMAHQVADIFTEVVVAPDFEPEALTILTQKKNIRLLRCPAPELTTVEVRPITGGALAQTPDQIDAAGDDPTTWTLAAGEPADEETLADLEFAWRACRAVKSNAIVLANSRATVGVGMGQVNRVDSAKLAVSRAGERAAGSVAASDGFFPFPDGLQVLIDAGVRAVVQPGGSLRDEEVRAAAQSAGIPLYLTGTRHFAH